MTYAEGRDGIIKMMTKYENTKHRRGVVDAILWRVARDEGVEQANAIIWLLDLDFVCNGGHVRFDCDKTGWEYQRTSPFYPATTPDDYRRATKRDNADINHLLKNKRKLEDLL